MFGFKIDKNRKYLLMGGVLLLLFGAVYRLWPSLPDFHGADEEILLKQKQIAKYQQVLQARGDLETQVKSLKKALVRGESQLFTGETHAIAAADIQKVLQKMAEKSQVSVKTVRVLKPVNEQESQYMSIPVQLNINGTIRHLKEFLYEIMISPKCLTVNEVAFRVQLRRRNVVQRIRADITVHGFLKRTDN